MKKKILATLLVLTLALGLLPGAALAANRQEICSAEEFAAMAQDGHYILMNDIQIEAPYGSYERQFVGTFDGNGHTVTLAIQSDETYQGLFSYIGTGGVIKNVRVAGYVAGGNMTGGIAGFNKGSIYSCSNSAAIQGKQYVGGIVGQSFGSGSAKTTIEGCVNSGEISGSKYVGGIAGKNGYGSTANCYNTGEIRASTVAAACVGGLIGQAANGSGSRIQACYTIGPVLCTKSGEPTQYGAAIGNLNTSYEVSACYYDESAYTTPVGFNHSDQIYKITDTSELLSGLQSQDDLAWIADTGINGGYPILSWQADAVSVPVSGVLIDGDLRSGKNLTARAWGAEGNAATDVRYQWQISDHVDGDFRDIPGISGQGFALTDAYLGKYIRVIAHGPEDSYAESSGSGPVLISASEAVALDLAAIGDLPPVIRTAAPLTLPVQGENGSRIGWSSAHPDVIDSGGTVTPPTDGKLPVILTARAELDGAEGTRLFSVLVYSQAEADAERGDAAAYLQNAADSLKDFDLSPTSGVDANINAYVKAQLAKNGYGELSVSVKSAENKVFYGEYGIAENGNISYFYMDPGDNLGNGSKQIDVVFEFSKDGAAVTYRATAVIGWDRAKLEQYIENEIFPALSIPQIADADFDLPKYIGGKGGITWAELHYAVSDESAMTISKEKQQGDADAQIYGPYVGKVKPVTDDRALTLTVSASFNRPGPGNEICIEKDYPITVKADPEAVEALKAALSEKLTAGLSAPGLTDFVTGAELDAGSVVNDIRFPTTRDFGVDGKFYPVTVTSSDPDVIETPDVNNAARVRVYRPLPGEQPETVTLTVRITEKASGIYAETEIPVTVQPLTQAEIDAEITLMEQVKAHYFAGIKNENTDAGSITSNLRPFQEAYLKDGQLTWAYDARDLVNHGIVPVAMDGWDTLEQWRAFRSGNAAVISHENLLVTRQEENKRVTVTSYLSSETLGKYAERYPLHPDFQKLYYQPVTASLIVAGTAPMTAGPVEETLTVSFTLQSADGTWISRTNVSGLSEGATVFDVFTGVLHNRGYGYASRGSSVYAVTSPEGVTLQDMDKGENSGWMYKVNGYIPSAYMAAHPLRNGDDIVVFFTRDYTQETAWSVDPVPEMKAEARANPDGSYTVDILLDGKRLASAPDGVKVCIPNVGAGQVVVIVNGDGTETVVKKSLIADGRAYLLLDRSATLKVVEAENPFADVDARDWYGDAVVFSVSRGLFNGVSETAFVPQGAMTRGMLATVLFRLEDNPDAGEFAFADVDAGAWYADAVCWAAQAGIVTGYENGAFAPEARVSRQQLATMLYRYTASSGVSTSGRAELDAYTDAGVVAGYAADAMAWAVDAGLLQGRPNGTLAPGAPVTRAEAAVFFQRLTGLLVK